MSRAFSSGSSQSLSNASAIVSGIPLTLACWFYTANTATQETLMSIDDGGPTYQHFSLRANGASDKGFDSVRGFAYNGSATLDLETSSGYSTNTWHHAAVTFASGIFGVAYIDGGNAVSDTNSFSVSGLSETNIGSIAGSEQLYNGRVAEAAIWNVALTAAEIAILAVGYSPLLIRPQNLVAYWPLVGRTSPEIDLVGSYGMTLNNAPTTAAHPRVLYPNRPHIILPASTVLPGALYRRRIFVVG